MENQPLKTLKSTIQIIRHWLLVAVMWFLLFFETKFIGEIMQEWTNPYYISKYPLMADPWGKVIALALCTVMALYTIGISIFIVIFLIGKRFKNIEYRALSRMHTVVLSGFLVYWLIFLAIFYRP